jgi:hypothetical protein
MSDYLWDKTGEPDAEVERLETLLGAFGHTPRRLELPATKAAAPPRSRRFGAWLNFIPARLFVPAGLAAAAALLLALLLGAGALMRARVGLDEGRAASVDVRQTRASSPQSNPPVRQASSSSTQETAAASSHQGATAAVRAPGSANVPAKRDGGAPVIENGTRAQSVAPTRPRQKTAAAAERVDVREGETGRLEAMSAGAREGAASLFDSTRLLAKEQLIYALRLTGAKLKEVQLKTRGADGSKTPARGGVR